MRFLFLFILSVFVIHGCRTSDEVNNVFSYIEVNEAVKYDSLFFTDEIPDLKFILSKHSKRFKPNIIPDDCYARLLGDTLHLFINNEGKMTFYQIDYIIHRAIVYSRLQLARCKLNCRYPSGENKIIINKKNFKVNDSIQVYIESRFIIASKGNPTIYDTIVLKGKLNLRIRERDYSVEKRQAEYAYQDLLKMIRSRPDTITELSLSGLRLTKIPDEILQIKNLKKLYLSYHKLEKGELKKLKYFENLEELYLYSMGITEIPIEILELKKLKILGLTSNPISEKELVKLSSLKQLEELRIDDCELNDIPIDFRDFKNLKTLDLANNNLKSDALTKISAPNLERLDISNNDLRTIPSSLFESRKLKSLNIANNRIFEFPTEITNLTYLKELDFRWNAFKEFPVILNKMQPLDYIGMIGNIFKARDYERDK